jgi:hypothetical protein
MPIKKIVTFSPRLNKSAHAEIDKSGYAPISGLHINVEKTESMELGVAAHDYGIQVKTDLTITGLVFSKNPAKMLEVNWNNVHSRVKKKLDGWSGRHLTIIGKANILKYQIQPLISFVGGILDLPDCMDKKLRTISFKFIWGGSDKEKRSLTYKKST